MFTRHYNVNDVTKSANVTLLLHATSGRLSPSKAFFLVWFFWDLFSVEKFQAILELQTTFATSIKPSKHSGSIKFDVKRQEKKLFLCRDCWSIGINLIIAILKHKRNRKFDFFSVRSIFISLMNTKSNIFTRGSATRENTTVGVHSVK